MGEKCIRNRHEKQEKVFWKWNILVIGHCYVILYCKSSATKKKKKKHLLCTRWHFLHGRSANDSGRTAQLSTLEQRWRASRKKKASGYRPLMVALTDTGGRTGDADEASGSQTQRASWEKGPVKIPEPASTSDPDQSPFEFQKQRPFQCETEPQGFFFAGRCARIWCCFEKHTHAHAHTDKVKLQQPPASIESTQTVNPKAKNQNKTKRRRTAQVKADKKWFNHHVLCVRRPHAEDVCTWIKTTSLAQISSFSSRAEEPAWQNRSVAAFCFRFLSLL